MEVQSDFGAASCGSSESWMRRFHARDAEAEITIDRNSMLREAKLDVLESTPVAAAMVPAP
jgi:hypothetical protein